MQRICLSPILLKPWDTRIEVHLSSYARFTPDATADLYAQVNAGTAQVN
ncbi:hypothetical protein [Prochlorococcus sp. MIT 1303]|nr:hypothetical protein [Prochlorococcus sp. MIT 1303]KZR64501.1 hypothetical protein PMIT1303_01546 [Prochlorococcus sp. MIT 1303]